ncbi:MAG: type I restriction endonuclease subunit R [Gammaproteobacteria bacterium]|nr:type I restriction endonuclease subunit R [Gammaproteobacteria bacterium]
MSSGINESVLERTAMGWLESLGYDAISGISIAPGEPMAERSDYDMVVLSHRLRDALVTINPDLPESAIDEAIRAVSRIESPSLIENNRRFHRFLTDGVDVSYRKDGREAHGKVWLVDLDDVENNDWLAVNQFTVVENRKKRRPDIVVFVNGLPIGVIELKNPADENATIRHAFNQLQTYKADTPTLFAFNELLLISDGLEARMGTVTSGWDRFMPWRTVDGRDLAPKGSVQLEVLLKGVFDKRRLLDLILNFVVFEDDGANVVKKLAAYHQFFAVNKALECTFSACAIEYDPAKLIGRFPAFKPERPGMAREERARYGPNSDHFGGQRIGVVWHTQGSGKSLSMTFYAGKVIRHPGMENPTLVIITDRNDLDDQLFSTFSRCSDLLRQAPVQAASRAQLQRLLDVPAGGVVFTTIQKFLPENKGETYPQLSDRRNIVVIADEAHRSQYDFIDGFARHMHDALPNASFIGFTATPIERDDRSTPAVFGDYIDKYDILRAVEDGATVPIYYEGRLARIELNEAERPRIDPEFEDITEGEEESEKQRLRTKWAALEAMVGAEKRIGLVADDLVDHLDRRLEAMDGKALVVCMSRRICVEMYNALTKRRPDWHHDDDTGGQVKIVMSGSASDKQEWQPHIRSKARREELANRFRDPTDPLKIVIVRDMWLTGFDCPCLHTMYVDKPMRGHGLMQAIARVNRVFKDKPGGLVVDYLGLAEQLKRALADYTEAGGRGDATVDQEKAVAVMIEKYEIVTAMFHGFDYRPLLTAEAGSRMAGIAQAMEHVLAQEDGKKRYLDTVSALSKAFALAVPHDEAIRIRDDVAFFQEVRSGLAKATVEGERKSREEMDAAVRQLVSRAVASDQVVDIFAAAGLKKPDISILSDDFLLEVRALPQRNLAVELLRKLLNDEIKARAKKNVVEARSFAEMLEEAVRKYQNRAIEAAQIIEELIRLAKEMQEARVRGEALGLTDDEVAFYDALEVNDSAVKVLGDECLRKIAQELVGTVRRSVTIDWTVRENARAKIRVMVKRILRKHGYPPDKQEKATQTVLEQAEVLCQDWMGIADS